MAACRVSYVDLEGFRHSVELEAGSLYEAAVLAVSTFRQHHFEPGDLTNLEVEIRTAITHTVLREAQDDGQLLLGRWAHKTEGAPIFFQRTLKEKLDAADCDGGSAAGVMLDVLEVEKVLA